MRSLCYVAPIQAMQNSHERAFAPSICSLYSHHLELPPRTELWLLSESKNLVLQACYVSVSSRHTNIRVLAQCPALVFKTRGRSKRRATHLVQHKRYRYKRNRQESQCRTRPRNSQILVHGRRKQGEPSAETTPHEIIARKHTSRILRICIW